MYAMLISSDNPYGGIYLPDCKWDLFNERIRTKGSALWGLNTGKPKEMSLPSWIYVHVKGSGQTPVRMHAINYQFYPEKKALLEDERRIPRFKEEKFKLYLEIDKIEILNNPIDTFSLKKRDGSQIENAPQQFSYIQDPFYDFA